MNKTRLKTIGAIFLVALLGLSLWWAHGYYNSTRTADGVRTAPLFRYSDRISTLEIEEADDGPVFVFRDENETLRLTPDEFAGRILEHQQRKVAGGWLFRLLDITGMTGLFWVSLGLLGQFMFTGRMLVQWWASEQQKRSVVPTAFWWLSLAGSSLLIIYFSWRIELVGILGQATGWFIYIRNLWFVYQSGRSADA